MKAIDTEFFNKEVNKLIKECGYTKRAAIEFMENFTKVFEQGLQNKSYDDSMKQ